MTRPKKCPQCGEPFIKERMGQKTCRKFECAVSFGRKTQAKQKDKEIKQRKEAIKPRADWMKEAQAAVNAYVRYRDRDQPCVSCDRPAGWDGQWHASHFKSVGANSFLRFNLWNIHKACSICNNHLSGNLIEYTVRLPGRIGKTKYDFLMTAPRVRSYDVDYLKRLIAVFKRKLSRAKKRHGDYARPDRCVLRVEIEDDLQYESYARYE